MKLTSIDRPRRWQIAALALGLASMFMEWTYVRYGTGTVPARLIDLMVEGPLPCLVLGTVFAAGLVLPLRWRRAALLPLCGLLLLTLMIVMGLDGYAAATDPVSALSVLGPGAYLAWAAALLSLPLRRSPSTVRHDPQGEVLRTSRRNHGTVTIKPKRSPRPQEAADPLCEEAMEQGDRELREGDPNAALRAYGRALGRARGGQRAACKVRIAHALRRMGRLEEAHMFFQEALEHDPAAWRGGEGRLLPIKVPTSKRRIRIRLSPEP